MTTTTNTVDTITPPPTHLPPTTINGQHAHLVKRIAHHLVSRLPPNVQVDDLIQSGMVGLLEAMRNFQSGQGASFETYAGIRIRGAMLDEIRRGDWAPRALHRKVRAMTRVAQGIEAELGRDARDHEVAAGLGMSLAEYHQLVRDANGHKIMRIEDLPAQDAGVSTGLTEHIAGPLECLEDDGFRNALVKAIDELPDRERVVLSLYYVEGLKLRQIGALLDVSESRVCQIHAQAVKRVRTRMEEWTQS